MAAKTVPAFLEFEGAPLYFDAVLKEVTRSIADVTEHNVEQGADVADHMRVQNAHVSLEIFVSNSPVRDVNQLYGGRIAGLELKVRTREQPLVLTPGGLFGALASKLAGGPIAFNADDEEVEGEELHKALVLQWPEKFDNVAYIQGQLIDWQERGVLGKVITPSRTYENVVVTLVEKTRTRETGDGANLTIECKGVRLVETKLVTAPIPTEARGKLSIAKGRQPTSFVRDPKPKMSLLKAAQNRLRK